MPLKKELIIFFLVGLAALLVHLIVVWLLVQLGHLHPLEANIIGFLVAVNVSYFGHSIFTFKQRRTLSIRAFLKFFSIASVTFITNQIVYYFGLKWFGVTLYLPILTVVLVSVGALTYLLSKLWVFAAHEHASN
ncbi:MAG: GtrA family protein [Methylotenera sp.]|nr:GtrA family protein [Methylotenera sp.]